jgi:hypothetical protein
MPLDNRATAGVVAVTLVATISGVDVAKCLVILMLAPTVTVVGSEVRVLSSGYFQRQNERGP